MPRYIDADAYEFPGDLLHVPTADVVEVKRGEWEMYPDEYEIVSTEFVCSICRETFCTGEMTDEEFLSTLKYCPNCGTKMKEGDT